MRRLLCILVAALACPAYADQPPDRPNIILIITDDQGYGDIAAHGNPLIQTPHLDALHAESVRLTDYHVDPTCSPTRSALMTGRYSTRTGVWHTINGRSMMHGDEYTLAELLRDHGYQTAMFGKWHLGDNAPLRPMDQGFDHAVWHKGGGITQGPDYFGNDYFDDTYDVNGQWKPFDGYCTDVFFREAMRYLDEAKDKDQPFFVYLSTNAPHGPFLVDEKYSKPYADLGLPGDVPAFYGMITNIDENVGKLRAYLEANGLAENTLLIFTTDNGTARGNFKPVEGQPELRGFNAGMRANKGSEYDGGHRVPFFLHWPAAGLDVGADRSVLAAHIDVLPTLADLCGLGPFDADTLGRGPIDGVSLVPAIQLEPVQARTLFVHSQRTSDPIKWRKSSVMTERWRLVNGKELYQIFIDPGQRNDVAEAHPQVVGRLRQAYEQWWASLEPVFDEPVRYDLGGAENPTTLMSHDWLMEGTKPAAWHQNHVRSNALIDGPFMVNIVEPGTYRITPRRWPAYVDRPSGCVRAEVSVEYANSAEGRGWGADPEGAVGSCEIELPAGPATLRATLTRGDGETFGAYFVEIERLPDPQ